MGSFYRSIPFVCRRLLSRLRTRGTSWYSARMSWGKQPQRFRIWSFVKEIVPRWWWEVTEPLGKRGLSPGRKFFRRLMLWAPAIVLSLVLVGGIGLYFLTAWRARDLARKAMENARAGGIRSFARCSVTRSPWIRPCHREIRSGSTPELARLDEGQRTQRTQKFGGIGMEFAA